MAEGAAAAVAAAVEEVAVVVAEAAAFAPMVEAEAGTGSELGAVGHCER